MFLRSLEDTHLVVSAPGWYRTLSAIPTSQVPGLHGVLLHLDS